MHHDQCKGDESVTTSRYDRMDAGSYDYECPHCHSPLSVLETFGSHVVGECHRCVVGVVVSVEDSIPRIADS